MEKFKVELSPVAWEELQEIFNYIIIDNKSSAEKTITEIFNSMKTLETSPNSGPYLPDFKLKSEKYRLHICGKYLCLYKIIDRNVYIHHIVHSSRDYEIILKSSI